MSEVVGDREHFDPLFSVQDILIRNFEQLLWTVVQRQASSQATWLFKPVALAWMQSPGVRRKDVVRLRLQELIDDKDTEEPETCPFGKRCSLEDGRCFFDSLRCQSL